MVRAGRRLLSLRDKLLLLIVVLLLFTTTVHAQTISVSSARSDALGGTVILSDVTPNDIFLAGASPQLNSTIAIELSYKRQYDLKELDILQSAVAYSKNNITFAGSFTQFGDPELYTQKLLRGGILYTKSKFTVGTFISSETHDFNNHYESLHNTTFGMSLSYFSDKFISSMLVDNVTKSKLTSESPQTFPKLKISTELLLFPNHITTLSMTTEKEKEKKLGIGESVKISQYAQILFGFSTAPKEFGAGLELSFNKSSFIYTSSYHPVLGLTHTVSFLFTH